MLLILVLFIVDFRQKKPPLSFFEKKKGFFCLLSFN